MKLQEVQADQIPLALLLEADPSPRRIQTYLHQSRCFAALDNDRVVSVCVAKALSEEAVELFNIATQPEEQGRGIGCALLTFVLAALGSSGFKRVELGTGTFGYQLGFYQRLGFRVESVIKDHFLDHYDDAIFESGIQHKDMLRLAINL